MIVSFRHKGLKRFFELGDRSKLNPDHVGRINWILGQLHAAIVVDDMSAPDLRLHALKGEWGGYWAVTVRANWRIVFQFEGSNAYNVDLVDYH